MKRILCFCLLLAMLAACNVSVYAESYYPINLAKKTQYPVAVEKIKIYSVNGEKNLYVGDTLKLAVDFTPWNAADQSVTWASSDKSVATVTKSGTVKGIAEGRAKITATSANGKKSSLTVTVLRASNSRYGTEMQISINASCKDTNGVGVDWLSFYSINGCEVMDGDTIVLLPGDELVIYSELIEDEEYPDIGSKETSHIVTEKDIQNGFKVTQRVQVTEDRGVYKGYSCYWNVTYKFH